MSRQPGLVVLAGAAWIACGASVPPDAPIADAAPAPDSIPLTCDTVGQDCDTHHNPGTEKCSLVQNGGRLETRCVFPEGHVVVGGTCRRSAGGSGHDSCVAGLYCTGRTLPVDETGFPLAFACRAFCREDASCDTGERCVAIGTNVPQDGICLPATCAFFDSSCGAGATCDPALDVDRETYVGLCRSVGADALDVGQDCTEGFCKADSFCGPTGEQICVAECDATRPCASGACRPFAGLPGGAGGCFEAAAAAAKSFAVGRGGPRRASLVGRGGTPRVND